MKKTFMSLLLSGFCLSAFAHSPFTAPSNYVVNGNNTSIFAGFADHAFDSEVAIRGFDFQVINPKGEKKPLEFVNTTSVSSANVESTIDGTYQIIGQRSASIQYAKVGKRWLRLMDTKGENLPPLEARSFVLPSELTTKDEKIEVKRIDEVLSYFSKSKKSDFATEQSKSGLTLQYSEHPNSIQAGQPFTLTVLLNKKAASGYQVQVEQQKTHLNEKNQIVKLTTDAKGAVQLPFKAAGQYLVTITSPEHKEGIKPETVTYRSILSVYVNP